MLKRTGVVGGVLWGRMLLSVWERDLRVIIELNCLGWQAVVGDSPVYVW